MYKISVPIMQQRVHEDSDRTARLPLHARGKFPASGHREAGSLSQGLPKDMHFQVGTLLYIGQKAEETRWDKMIAVVDI